MLKWLIKSSLQMSVIYFFVFIFIIWHLYKYCIEWKYQLCEYTLFANSRVSIYLCLSSGNFSNERDEKDPFHWHDEWKFWFEWIYSAGQRLLLPNRSFTGWKFSKFIPKNLSLTRTFSRSNPPVCKKSSYWKATIP